MTTSTVNTAPSVQALAHFQSRPLTWLWPNRIPLGHLTLLDAAPGSGLSLFALTLAACITSGSPLPDGTHTQQGTVLLIAPYATPEDTILPRFMAAGGDPTRLVLYRPTIQETPQTTVRFRTLDLPRDLDHLSSTIQQLDVRLVIIDPASSVTGLKPCLPALIELARHTNCAILLTRSLRQAPADPLHTATPSSPLLEAACSRLLLTPDPLDEQRHLLLTTKHSLSAPSSILSYDIRPTETGTPTIHWLGERDRTSLERIRTAPLHSVHRQAILRFLHTSPSPKSIKDILSATCYDYEPGRKMLLRMKTAGELVSPASGLYTTVNHPCLANYPARTSHVPNVPAVSEDDDITTLVSRTEDLPYEEAFSFLWKALMGDEPDSENIEEQPGAEYDSNASEDLAWRRLIHGCLSHRPDAPWRYNDLT